MPSSVPSKSACRGHRDSAVNLSLIPFFDDALRILYQHSDISECFQGHRSHRCWHAFQQSGNFFEALQFFSAEKLRETDTKRVRDANKNLNAWIRRTSLHLGEEAESDVSSEGEFFLALASALPSVPYSIPEELESDLVAFHGAERSYRIAS